MPEEYTEGHGKDAGKRRNVHDAPNLVFETDDGGAAPVESPNKARKSFYARQSVVVQPPSSELDPVPGSSEAESIAADDREFLFPMERDRRKASLPETILINRPAHPLSSPRSYHRFRHSISVTDPVCRSTYDSLPQSPAATFLSQFAQPDDWREQTKLEDGSIIDRYQLGKIIGRGSFSTCREGTPISSATEKTKDPATDKVALKIVKDDDTSEYSLADFDREVAIWRRLKHKNILPLLDFLRLDKARIAVSPFAENGTLLDYITNKGPLTEAEAKIIFRQIVEALAHMHRERGIIHRDIKLDNILLDAQLSPYICDFGLSECIGPMGQTEAPPILLDSDGDIGDTGGMKRTEGEIFCKGSLWYLSPEELEPELFRKRDAALSEPEARKKGDVWALGVVLYGMVTGKLPFTDDFLPRLQMTVTSGEYPALPDSFTPALRDLVSKLLTVDIVLRPSIDMVLAHPWLKT
jgi:hypothetical protein